MRPSQVILLGPYLWRMSLETSLNAILPGQSDAWRRFLGDALTVTSGLRNASLLDYQLPSGNKQRRKVLSALAKYCDASHSFLDIDVAELQEIEGFTFIIRKKSIASVDRLTIIDARSDRTPTVLNEVEELRLKSLLKVSPSPRGPLIVPLAALLLEYPFAYFVGEGESDGQNSLGGVPLVLCAIVVNSRIPLSSPEPLVASFPCLPSEFISHSFSVPLEISKRFPMWQSNLLEMYSQRIQESKVWSGVRIVTKEATLTHVLL